jgi:RHS repeat-associated protein
MQRTRLRKISWALLVIGACQSTDGDRTNRGVDMAEVQSPLTASTTLSQALAFKITSGTAGTTISAGIAGEPTVGHDGSANYRVAIWVPDGIDGLRPELAVEYNSEGGVGLLGPRWHLSGLSAITRCAKTRAQDGTQAAVDFQGDTFCMDGQRLVRAGASSLVFYTERESFTKIVASKNASGDFSSFKAYQRDGRIFHYGSSHRSRLHGNPAGIARDVSYAYYLDKITDRYSNEISITYLDAVAQAVTGTREAQELVPGTITWGPTGQRILQLSYEPLPSTPQVRWVRGFGIRRARYLTRINVLGPDASGLAQSLKQYSFTYDTKASPTGPQIVTGDRVLATISECDGAGWCKKQTTINWEAGANTFTKVNLAADDATFATPYTGNPFTPQNEPQQTNYARIYRRMMAADLDGDGRDDVIYRGYLTPPHHDGFFDCVGWSSRRSTMTSGDTTGFPVLGAASQINVGSDPDTSCRASLISANEFRNAKGGNAWPGDLILVDLNNDGFTDIVSPIGKSTGFNSSQRQSPVMVGYRAYLNKGTSAPGTFGNPINFLDSNGQPPSIANFGSAKSMITAIGDINGDGLPEVIRPTENPPLHLKAATLSGSGLTAKTETRSGQTFPFSDCTNTAICSKAIADTPAFLDVSVLDIDGDGTAEILRTRPPCAMGQTCLTDVTSPSMNTTLNMPPADTFADGYPPPTRWFLDLNGDGLLDVAWVDPFRRFLTALGNGSSFGPSVATGQVVGAGGSAFSATVVDINLDGRQDLLLDMAIDPQKCYALLSDGRGGFTPQEYPIQVLPADNLTGTIQRIAADLNGDGLTDFLQMEADASSVLHVMGYVRDGKAPGMVTAINEGSGRSVHFGYDVSSTKDPAFYAVQSAETCNTDRSRLDCLNRGRWLTRSLTIIDNDGGASFSQTFTYAGGVSNKDGRGFLGFKQRDIYGPGTRHTTLTYDLLIRLVSGSKYVYPYALTPRTVRNDVDTPQGTNRHHYDLTTHVRSSAWQSTGTFKVTATETNRYVYDCPTGSAGGTCTGTARMLSGEREIPVLDSYGNVTKDTRYLIDPAGTIQRTDTDLTYFTYNTTDISNWLISQLDPTRPATRSSNTLSPSETVTRTIKFTPDAAHGGIVSAEYEPNGDATTRLLRTFGRDPQGRLTSVTDYDASTNLSRSTGFFYDDADQVVVSRIRNPLGHETRFWRHPGYGFVVEVDDPNGLAATRSFDTFGRLTSRTEISGKSTTVSYQDGPGTGANLTITPAGLSTRQTTIHLDSFGRETIKKIPVDAGRVLAEYRIYDEFGQLFKKTIKSGPASAPSTVLNTHTFTYDHKGRLLSDSHAISDGGERTRSYVYDGLNITETDESGRTVTRILDHLGRTSIQRANLASGWSDATFSYGAFGVLKMQTVSDGSGRTDLAYDVLGRQTSIKRQGAGIRRATYNAFGDVVATYKQKPDGTQVDNLTYERDALGRPRSVLGSGIERYFFWDTNAWDPRNPSLTAPYAVGKLVDVLVGSLDPSVSASQVHFDYGANGLISKQTWSASHWGGTRVGTAQFGYDSQGRVSTLTYPVVIIGTGWTPLAISYAYDPYNGEVSAITESGASGPAIWSANSRNEWGDPTSETMAFRGSNQISRTTSYFLPDGRLKTANIGGGGAPPVDMSYTYQANGLPATFGVMSPASGSWTSTFDYDNLKRLTSWLPSAGAPTVTYSYDEDGNLTKRAWPTETVNYTSSATARTVTVVQNGSTVRTDAYQMDEWGRVFDTPAVTLTYNADDQVTSVTEKATGRVKQIILDGSGQPVLTFFGEPNNGQPLGWRMTLGDLYEFDNLNLSNGAPSFERHRLRAGGKLIGEILRYHPLFPSVATFFMTDNVGSVVAEATPTPGSASTLVRSRRDPYGNLLQNAQFPLLLGDAQTADPDGTGRMAFADHPREADWGLVNMVSRYYSPRLGRFVSPDSMIPDLQDRRSYNPFAYVENSPTAMFDPTGHCGVQDPEGDQNNKMCPDKPIYICTDAASCKELGRRIGAWSKRQGSKIGNAAEDAWNVLSNSNGETVGTIPPKATISSPPATATSTSPNATLAAAVPRAGGSTGAGGAARAGDALDLATAALGQAAKHTPIPVWAPPTFGPFGNTTGLQFTVTSAELEASAMLRNATGPLKATGMQAVKLAEAANKTMETGGVALSWLESIEKFLMGDTAGGLFSASEGAFLLSASRAGDKGALFAAGYAFFKIMLHADFQMGRQGATYVPDAPGIGHWEMPAK